MLLDGLDEIDGALRRRIEGELKSLAQQLSSAKLIVTCRSGDYSSMIEGFNVVELCPLSWEQVSQIASIWLSEEADAFMVALKSLPYSDLADRPLLLAQLLLLFKRQGYLPEQPSEIYRRIVRLLLEDWDSQRRIRRGSQYSRFASDRKLEFLATLAYRLTYKIKTKVFSEKDLIVTYQAIYQKFGLPEQEAERVAHEVESHTGIIIAGAANKYEFSHLSIQEFLCAEYLVRDAFPSHLTDYVRSYPAPIAIAVAISSDPSNWMAGLFLRTSRNCGHFTEESLSAFLSRLFIERPYFEVSPVLGHILLRMFSDFCLFENLRIFATTDLASRCLGAAFNHYEAIAYKDQKVRLRLLPYYRNRSDIPAPYEPVLPFEILENIVRKGAGRLSCNVTLSSSWTISKEEELEKICTLLAM